MAPKLEQTTANSHVKHEGFSIKLTFDRPTKPGSLIIASLVAAGGMPVWEIPDHSPYTLVKTRGLRDVQLTVWMRENAPPTTSITLRVWGETDRSLQARAFEISGVAQSGSLDKIVTYADDDNYFRTGTTGLLSRPDSMVLGIVANQYASATQGGFYGGLVRLFESVSPREGRRYSDEDWERSRVTYHMAVTNAIKSFELRGRLSTSRRWLAFLLCFKGGSLGPKRLSAKDPSKPIFQQSGRGMLSAFGPLKATRVGGSRGVKPMSSNPEQGTQSIVAPFYYQYRLGGWNGLLIGSGTDYKVESTEGLGGWTARTSDSPIPRGDGDIRGIDLESARQIIFTINVGRNREQIELLLDRLYRALIPQRDDDWELIWRHPTQPPKMMRVRPIELPRLRNSVTNQSYAKQTFALRAADPRHYSAAVQRVTIPNTPANATSPTEVNVSNMGDITAYPIIYIDGPTSGPPVTRVQITNRSTLQQFNLELSIPTGSRAVGDMDSRVTGSSRPVITLDGQPRYGAWQLPREPFAISADPTGLGGYNVLYMETIPAGAPIRCTLEYRHTWSG